MRGRWRLLSVALLLAVLAGCGGEGDEAAEADEGSGDEGEQVLGDESEGERSSEEPDEEPEEPAEEADPPYVVKAGDTLSSIADEFDVTVDELVEANEIEDPDVLHEGQELVIP